MPSETYKLPLRNKVFRIPIVPLFPDHLYRTCRYSAFFLILAHKRRMSVLIIRTKNYSNKVYKLWESHPPENCRSGDIHSQCSSWCSAYGKLAPVLFLIRCGNLIPTNATTFFHTPDPASIVMLQRISKWAGISA